MCTPYRSDPEIPVDVASTRDETVPAVDTNNPELRWRSAVLYVDRTPLSQDQYDRWLHAAGFAVHRATQDHVALDILSSEPIQLVLLNLQRLDVQDIEFVRELRGRPGGAAVSVLALHGPLYDGRQSDVDRIDVTDYLIKPVNHVRLLETVRHYLPIDTGD
jgi:DNA-binding response OmpR family regulator